MRVAAPRAPRVDGRRLDDGATPPPPPPRARESEDASELGPEGPPGVTVRSRPSAGAPKGRARVELRELAAISSKRFVVVHSLGAGSTGVVYRAHDLHGGGDVALKTLPRRDLEGVNDLKREFRTLVGIAHKNLVTLQELFADNDDCFFTMELVEGSDFFTYVRGGDVPLEEPRTSPSHAQPPSSRTEAERWSLPTSGEVVTRLRAAASQLAEGLVALHDNNTLHLDIKPSNVMVRPDGRVVLLDFGLARDLVPTFGEAGPERDVAGTPGFMSPEQARGDTLTAASDWYSVGVMLYQALTGRLPYTGDAFEVLARKQRLPPPEPPEAVRAMAPDLCDLAMALLRRLPRDRPSSREVLERLGASAASRAMRTPEPFRQSPFIGRAPQLRALQDCFEEMSAGRPITVYLSGPSGIGKTVLVKRFLAGLEKRSDVVTIRGRCYERESLPYKAFDSVIDSLAKHLQGLPPHEAEKLLPRDVHALIRLFPALERVPTVMAAPRPSYETPEAQEVRRRGFAALKELLRKLASFRALVVWIDDLQWGDADSAELLLEVVSDPEPPPMLFIGSFRSEEPAKSPCLSALAGRASLPVWSSRLRDLQLGPLDLAEAGDLARALLSFEAASEADAAEIARESEGNPFFVSELSRAFDRSEAGAARPPIGRLSLDYVLRDRFAQLPAEAQKLLEIVAVAGGPVRQSVAARAAGLTGGEPGALSLLRAGHVVRTSGGPADREIEINHDRIRQSVIQRLEPAELRACHRRLAASLEESGGADAELLATHYREAGDRVRAGRYAADAAFHAARTLAFERAVRLFELALSLHPSSSPQRRLLETGLGDALANAGRGEEAARAYLRAATFAAPADVREMRRRAAEQLLRSGRISEGSTVIQAVLGESRVWMPSTPRRALASLYYHRALLFMRGLEFEDRPEHAVAPEVLARIDLHWTVTVGLTAVDMIRASDFAVRTLLLSLDAGEPYRVARALAFESVFISMSGADRRRAAGLVAEVVDLARRVDRPHILALSMYAAGTAESFGGGYWENALEKFNQAEAIFRDRCTGVTWELVTTQVVASWALFYLGRIHELSRRIPTTLKEAEQRGDLYAQAMLSASASWVALAADDPTGARRKVTSAMKRWSLGTFHLQHYVGLLAEAYIDRYSGMGHAAYRRFEERWPKLEGSMLLRVKNNFVMAHVERALSAIAAAATVGPERALLRAAERGAKVVEREGLRWGVPYVSTIRAGIALVRGETAAAHRFLEEAAAQFGGLGMALHAAACRLRRGELLRGELGREMVLGASALMDAEGIRCPVRWAHMLVPG